MMTQHFVVTLRFPDSRFHGRAQQGEREWPPSPLRVFQALVASAARLNPKLDGKEADALRLLEKLPAPEVAAPNPTFMNGYVLSVPNNEMDLVGKAWAAGKYFDLKGENAPSTHRTMKRVSPILMPADSCIRYFWQLEEGFDFQPLIPVARAMSALGWGMDLVIGDAMLAAGVMAPGTDSETWRPVETNPSVRLRVPLAGTFHDLQRRHGEFLGRLGADGASLTPPSPLSSFRMVGYRRTGDQAQKTVAAFKFMLPDATHYRAFDAARRGLTVSGMMRHVLARCARQAGWVEERVNSLVLGHPTATNSEPIEPALRNRFTVLPLPSIEFRGPERGEVAGSIRRVIVTSFAETMEQEIRWAGKALSGNDLFDESTGEVSAILAQIPSDDRMVERYCGLSSDWTTVTPVVLPGFDDPDHLRRKMEKGVSEEVQKHMLLQLESRIDGLLRKAIIQAGYPKEWAQNAIIDWNRTGFFPGVQPVSSYGIPDHLKKYPRYHVRLSWKDGHGNPLRVAGPLCLGSGRYLGVGLFVGVISR